MKLPLIQGFFLYNTTLLAFVFSVCVCVCVCVCAASHVAEEWRHSFAVGALQEGSQEEGRTGHLRTHHERSTVNTTSLSFCF